MSDYCTPCRYRRKGLLEDDACPFNALYWSFLLRNERAFSGNRRMTLVIKQLQGRDAAWRVAVTNKADAIRARLRSGDPI
jgi:deoxyribodipyrimidine photolyase-related protein